MRKRFLTGNFLRAYSDAYSYPKDYGKPDEKADVEWLRDRFTHRGDRSRRRRSNYITHIQIALGLALLVAVGATRLDVRSTSSFDVTMSEQETVDLQEIVQTRQEVLPPPPPRPAVPIVVADDEILESDELDLDASLDLTQTAASIPPPPAPEEEEQEVEREVFVVVEEQPEIIGGAAALADDVEYPTIARQAGIEGMVVVKIVVTEDGQPVNPEILRSPSDVLNKAAIDAVMKQRFKPGRQRGRAVAVQMSIPVQFRLT